MATLTHPNRLLRHFSDDSSSRHRMSRHPILGTLGLLIVVLGIIGFVSILPDIYRYARMKTM